MAAESHSWCGSCLQPPHLSYVLKLLSVNPEYPDAPREAIRRILGSPAGQPIDHSRIESIRMGTTVATNALLERKGTKTALCITKGFKEPFQINY